MAQDRHSDRANRLYGEALRAIELLEGDGYAARLAGGCVRDRLLGIPPADFDVATSALPQQVIELFKTAGLRTVPTGIDHGTVTLVMPSGPIEITTLRSDVKTDGRFAEVAFGCSFEEDAARRDFTINALFEDRQGQIYDFFGGQQDLELGILRFVGEADRRICEDYLRILRLFRFQARFGYQAAPGTMDAIIANHQGLSRISQERITAELLKTVAAPHAAIAWQAMRDCGILALVLPEFAHHNLPIAADVKQFRTRYGDKPPAPWLCLAYFLLFAASPVSSRSQLRTLGQRLRLPKRDIEKLAFAADAYHRVPAIASQPRHVIMDFVDDCEKSAGAVGAFSDDFAPLLTALGVDVTFIEKLELLYGHIRRTRLPVDGQLLQAQLGIRPGAELGLILETLRCEFRDGLWETSQQALARARQLVNKT